MSSFREMESLLRFLLLRFSELNFRVAIWSSMYPSHLLVVRKSYSCASPCANGTGNDAMTILWWVIGTDTTIPKKKAFHMFNFF